MGCTLGSAFCDGSAESDLSASEAGVIGFGRCCTGSPIRRKRTPPSLHGVRLRARHASETVLSTPSKTTPDMNRICRKLQLLMSRRVHPIWHETFLPLVTPQPIPSCAEAERRLRAFALQNRDGVRGRPPFRPAGDPVAQSAACVRPTVSPPVRRPDVRGCSPSSVVGRQFRRFGRACQAPASKPAAQGRAAFMVSGCSSAMSGQRGSGEIRFMVGGGRPKADHVGFLWKRVAPRCRASPGFGVSRGAMVA